MNALWNLLPSGGWERLLADAAWQSTAIAACALIAARLVRRRPALRAAILFTAAALALVVPLLSSGVRLSGGGVLAPVVQDANHFVISSPDFSAGDRSGPTHIAWTAPVPAEKSAVAETSPTAGGWTFRPWRWIVGCWLAASAFLAFRLVRGVFAVRRWINMASPCHDAAIEAELSRAAKAIGVSEPELLWCTLFESPALVVLGRARLLLPSEMPAEVDWFAVFCHELAHRARHDPLSRLVVEVAVIALPWQPLLWVVRRTFRAACEEACDDWAVAAGADPVEFASLLVALVPERRPAFALGMAESPSATRHRILRLLGMQGTVHPRLGLTAGVAGWVAAIALAIALALLQFNSRPRLSDPVQLATTGERGNDKADPRAVPFTNGAHPAAPPWGNTPLPEAIAQAARDLPKVEGRPASYTIEPPDILLIDCIKLVPKSPYHIEPLDMLKIQVANPLIDQPIDRPFAVDTEGAVDLGPAYGKVLVAGQTLDEALKTIVEHLRSVLRDPQVSVTLDQTSGQQQIAGEHLVGPDGTVNIGTYGTVYVAGMTVADATAAVEKQLSTYLEQPRVSLDVYAFNSKVYYIVVEGGESGDFLIRTPITGNETVLDGLAQSTDGKIPSPANCWVWVARPVSLPARTVSQYDSTTEGASERDIFAPLDGVVDEVMVDVRDRVKQGQVLLRLRNRELETSIIETAGSLQSAQEKIHALRSALNRPNDGDDEKRSRLESEIAKQKRLVSSYEEQLKLLQNKKDQLTVTSPIDGQVQVTWVNLREGLLNRPVKSGQVLLSIVAPEVKTNAGKVGPMARDLNRSELTLPVDLQAVLNGDTTSNWRLMPGDRIFISPKRGG